MKVYAIVPTNWNYDDEWYSAEGFKKPTEAYHDKAKAEARALELNKKGTSVSLDDINECDRDTPFFSVVEVEVPDLTPAQVADEPVGESAYQKAQRLKAGAAKAAAAAAESALKEGAKLLFEKHPLLTSFTFRCYTPYFCDGDPCHYGVYADEPDVNGEDWEECELVSSGEKHAYVDGKYTCVKTGEPGALYEAWSKDIPRFVHSFDSDDIETLFGDHTKVTVKYDRATKEVSFEQDDYDHD